MFSELQDYSLGQIAFAAFVLLFAVHTAALTCKRVVNKHN